MKNRIRLTPETLIYKYTGLLFGWPLLIAVTLILGWAAASLALDQQMYDAEIIITLRNVFYVLTAVSGVLSVVLNLGDIGNGPLCTVGRIVMPLADSLYIGKRLRRFAHRQARRDPIADYEADLEGKRQYAAEMAAHKERQKVEGPDFSLPWKRTSDPFMLRRSLEIGATVGVIVLYWLVTSAVRDVVPSFLAVGMRFLGIAVAVLSLIHILLLLVTNKPDDVALRDADRLIALFRRKRR